MIQAGEGFDSLRVCKKFEAFTLEFNLSQKISLKKAINFDPSFIEQ